MNKKSCFICDKKKFIHFYHTNHTQVNIIRLLKINFNCFVSFGIIIFYFHLIRVNNILLSGIYIWTSTQTYTQNIYTLTTVLKTKLIQKSE